MTLRVNISIVPYGIESDEYQIARIDIHNVRQIENQGFGNQICEYKAEFKKFVGDDLAKWETIDITSLIHNRRDGSVRLAEMACRAFEDSL